MMGFFPEHPKWDQNSKFTPLSETTSIPIPFICGVPPPGWDMDWERQELRRGIVVSGLFFCSCSLGSLFLASILKVIATVSNVSASWGFGSLESVWFCFPIAPQDIWGLLYIIINLSAFSDRSLLSRMWDKKWLRSLYTSQNLMMSKYNLKVGVFDCTKAVQHGRFLWRMQIV